MTCELSTLPVVLATDENYAVPCGVVMESILQNTKAPSQVVFFVFESDVTEETKIKLSRLAKGYGAKVVIQKFDTSRFQHLPQEFSADAYTRLYAPHKLQQFPRILYLDCDVLVERDIQGLFEFDLGQHVAGAVPNGPTPFIAAFNRRHGFSKDDHVFNSGVLLIHPERWVREKVGDRAVSWIEDHAEEVNFPDQEGINLILKNQIQPLDAKWNMEARHYREWWMGLSDWWPRKAKGEKLVVHYTGSRKPWKRWTYVPRQRAYRAYLKATPFSSSHWLSRFRPTFEINRIGGGIRLMAEAGRVRLGRARRKFSVLLS